uniref:Uncharacterized protein n=1 Tax=Oryza sativa subsp. japonica TaxID=39947 RepID=Q6H4B6_ORYSJ|nr:hypothetical protein [Oryza sativa Japonica Group]BAD26433.1 hypothetical protein [Oryza sativa Japonica Group]
MGQMPLQHRSEADAATVRPEAVPSPQVPPATAINCHGVVVLLHATSNGYERFAILTGHLVATN